MQQRAAAHDVVVVGRSLTLGAGVLGKATQLLVRARRGFDRDAVGTREHRAGRAGQRGHLPKLSRGEADLRGVALRFHADHETAQADVAHQLREHVHVDP